MVIFARSRLRAAVACLFGVLAALSFSQSQSALAASDLTVYGGALASGWADWSWDTAANFNNTSPVTIDSKSIAVSYTVAWGGFYLHGGSPLAGSDYTSVRFWIDGGTSGGQQIAFKVVFGGSGNWSNSVAVTPKANTWTQITVPLSSIGSPTNFDGLVWQDSSGSVKPTFYLDDIVLVAAPSSPPSTPALSVDASAARHAISPYVYGMDFADESLAAELHLPVDRYGGNATTRYSWQNDTANRASDWYFENIPNANSNPGQLPNGSESDQFVDRDRAAGAKTIMTVPLIGWTPKSRAVACGFSVAKYGAQQSVDPYQTDCGNGVSPSGANIVSNSPADTSVAITPVFVQNWIQHLIGRYGSAANGGVLFYDLDNEPMLWNSSHRDVHPSPTSYDEMRDRTYQYAAAMKAVDPNAQILGPVEWGWDAYFYSALDEAGGGAWWTNPPDRAAHGGIAYVPWYLQQMRTYEQQNGVRILDYLDLHYYPQANGVTLSPAGDANTQALRLRSTRSLWDPTYADESWINQTPDGPYVRLIPRMRDWVAANYPGTKIAMDEYNWGGLESLNGALAEADVLGIFGRERLDLAALWDPPASSQPGAFAFRMYRNYDGAGSEFGDTGVQAASTDQDRLAIYAAQRTLDGSLTVMIINKSTGALTTSANVTGIQLGSTAAVYRYDGNNLGAIVRQPDQPVGGSGFAATFPASSITLFVVPAGSPSPTTPSDTYIPWVVK
jgi:hypothetical protein